MMKKIILIPMVFAVLSLSAQNIPSSDPPVKAEELSPKEMASLKKDWEKRAVQRDKAMQRFKTQGVVNQRMSHTEIADVQYGTLLRTVFSPFAPDSNFVQDFGTPDNINSHGFGQTFDPTSPGFAIVGQPYFHPNDAYTIDTIYIGMRYRTGAPTTGLTGDTLQVVTFKGNNQDNSVWRVGIGYSAGTFPGQTARINILTPRYTGNANIGTPGTINTNSKVIYKHALSDVDTTINYIKIVPSAPIQVAAGEKFGVFCTFIPGYNYDPLTQKYYISGATADVNNMSWLYLTRQNTSDDTPYFLEPLQLGAPSEGISNTLFSNTRYGAWTGTSAFRNEYPSPSTLRGNLIDFWVTGTSTIGLNETSVSEGLTVYPNPSNGKVSIQLPSGGQYELSVRNMTGKEVYNESVSLNSDNTIERDFSELPKGIYLVNLSDEVKTRTTRLVIQ